jgi:putative transposase
MSKLQQMDKEDRDAILVKLKAVNGVSVRQLSRITGISSSVVQRAH